ncbi:unnamed protein product [Absidia cylindrospora]
MTYANQSNNLCIPAKVNFLNRKTAFKKWKEGLYVLTPCGYLHGFKNARHFETEPLSPEISLFLPNATVSATDEQAEDLCFQIAMGRKKRMSLGGQKVFIFQANDESDLADWYSEAQRLSQVNAEHEVMDMEVVPPALPGMEPHEREQEYADNERLALAAAGSSGQQSNRLIGQGDETEEAQQQQDRTMMESSDDDDHYDSNAKPTVSGNNNLSTAAVLPESPRLQRYQPASQRQKSKSPLSNRTPASPSSARAAGTHTPTTDKDDAATADASTKDLYPESNGQRGVDDDDDDDFVQKYNDKLIVDDDDEDTSGKNKSTAFTSGNDGFVPRTSRIKEVL